MDVLNIIVVDESGSMGVQQDAVIGGINGFLDGQTAETEGNCFVSLVKFYTDYVTRKFDVHCVGEKAESVVRLNRQNYNPNGGTPLYDAVGVAVKGAEKWLENNTWFEGKVVVTIYTDGGENQSREWHLVANANEEDDRDINNLIKYKSAEGWEWIMLGSGGSAWLEAAKFTAIPEANRHDVVAGAASSLGTYAVLNNATTTTRRSKGAASNVSYAASFNNDVALASITADEK